MEEKNTNLEISEKSKQLIEKIDILTEKMEQEKSPLKKHILAFKVKMLISKIQREIDLNNIKSDYQTKRDELKILREAREEQGIDNIAELNEQIQKLKREIQGNEEYDMDSPNFMYPKRYVEEIGGPEALANKLKQSKKIESQQAAKRIESIAYKRKQLAELEEKLVQEQEDLDYSKSDYENDIKSYNREEKSLILKEKLNIFSRIGLFFSNMAQEFKLYREEVKQNKELDAKMKEEESALDEEYRKKMEELKEEHRKAKEELREEHDKVKEEQQQQQGADRAAEFRSKMSEMAKVEEAAVEVPTSDNEQAQENTQQESQEDPFQGDPFQEDPFQENYDEGR